MHGVVVRRLAKPSLLYRLKTTPCQNVLRRFAPLTTSPYKPRWFSSTVESEPVTSDSASDASASFASSDTSEASEATFQEAMQLLQSDEKRAASLLKEAAEQGHPQALTQMGHLHTSGQGGVSQDPGSAYWCYKQAADKNDPEGLRNLANCHIRGIGVDKNVYKSVPFLERAAELGEGSAQTLLGIFYYSGVAGERDLYKAADSLVSGLNNDTTTDDAKEDAGKSLFVICNQFMEGGDLARKDEHKAFSLLNELIPHAGESYKLHALYLLAQCHGTGIGTEQDMDKAMDLLHQASALGSPEAKDMLEKFAAMSDAEEDTEEPNAEPRA